MKVITTQEIEDFYFKQLLKRGFTPTQRELEAIADIMFDYLIHLDILEEEDK